MPSETPTTADYIIVGGGLAGCVVASRLHKGNPGKSVILIEAGVDPSCHPFTEPLHSFAAHYSDLDYAYSTVPQPHLNHRSCYAAAGKALSGGSAINYGTWTRGPAIDFDNWADKVGDRAWSYEALLPYFKKTENYIGVNRQQTDEKGFKSEQHGFDGPIRVVSVSASDPRSSVAIHSTDMSKWMEWVEMEVCASIYIHSIWP
ncbi:GMC oxidoreductase, partial [Lipomyces kononenkoae]